ncbi:MAG: hypothetical protein LZF60_170097 [Nitrospira sp.]|nr:MAG: hypothetical protein LZF60_170097 [Nitrospira sp.]
MFRRVHRMLALLLRQAGGNNMGGQPERQSGVSVTHQGGDYDAGSENQAEYWNVGCINCDRRGVRCCWCAAGIG